jgi:hypothetical protein
MHPQPFDKYPPKWTCESPPPRSGGNCRHEYGRKLMQETDQRACAYCGLSLVDTYEHWLLMAVDHVVPRKAGNKIGIPSDWLAAWANNVLACSACNTFANRFDFPNGEPCPTSWEAFLKLRDETFHAREQQIRKLQAQERQFYFGRPWEQPSSK